MAPLLHFSLKEEVTKEEKEKVFMISEKKKLVSPIQMLRIFIIIIKKIFK